MSAQGMPLPKPDPVRIFDTIQGYQRAFALKASIELDVFTAIARGSHTAAEIAKASQASERGVRILCDAMGVMGFLAKTNGRYSLTPDTAFFLDRESPAYLGHALKFLMHPTQLTKFEHLPEAARRGGASDDEGTLAPEDPIWVEFARGMAPLMMPAAHAMAGLLEAELAAKPTAKILDIAASLGLFGLTVAQKLPRAHIYALDWANVLEVARENAQRQGMNDRYHLLPGSAFDVDFGSGYDAVLLTNFLHHFTAADNEKLLKKIAKAMNPGGELVILEFVPNPDRVTPPVPALFSVNMLAGTPQGDAYTFAELEKMCAEAGFAGARLMPLEGLPQSLVLARKSS